MSSRHNGPSVDEPRVVDAYGHYYGVFVDYATGMVAVQAFCTPAKALDLLVDYAAQHESTVDEAASDVINRRLRFGGHPRGVPA